MEWFVNLFFGLIPPRDEDPVKIYAWRWKSVILGCAALVIGCYAANFLPLVEPPYAMANAVTDLRTDLQAKIDTTNLKVDRVTRQIDGVQAQLKQGQIRSLNSDLIDARRYQCRSINSNDKSALPFWNTRVQELKLSYESLSGVAWPDLPCNSF